jgi:hypothetical protein
MAGVTEVGCSAWFGAELRWTIVAQKRLMAPPCCSLNVTLMLQVGIAVGTKTTNAERSIPVRRAACVVMASTLAR